MSGASYFAAKRAAEGKPWRSWHCGRESHLKCHGGYNRLIEPVGWVPCCCDCHEPEENAASDQTPAGERAPDAVDDVGSERVVGSLSPAGQTPEGQRPSVEAGGVLAGLPVLITAPCVIDDMTDEEYHRDPVSREYGGSLSNSGAKLLYSQTPAHFAWRRENGGKNKRTFDIGHAVHARVLGVGAEVVRIDADSYRTNAAKEARDAAYAAGKVPLLAGEVDEVGAMAEAVLRNKTARVLFEADTIREQSIFWQDVLTGMYLRCRPDSRVTLGSGRRVLVDLKTAANADPARFGRMADDFGYCQQHPFYMAGAQAHGLVDADSSFLFCVVEKEQPYLTSVVELDEEAVRVGRQRNRKAIDLFADCTENNDWPGYTTSVAPVSLPYWTVKKHDEEFENE